MIATIAELDRVRAECRRMVASRALAAAGVAVVPIPGADIAADVGLLAELLPRISAAFGLDHAGVEALDPPVRRRLMIAAAGFGNGVIGRVVSRRLAAMLLRRMAGRLAAGSVARLVPVLGSAIGATIGFGAIRAVGNAHVEDCYRAALTLLPDPLAPPAALPPPAS